MLARAKVITELTALADRVESELSALADAIAEARLRRDFVEVGGLLLKAKAVVPHGHFQDWLGEIGLPYHHAFQAMRLWKQNRELAKRAQRA